MSLYIYIQYIQLFFFFSCVHVYLFVLVIVKRSFNTNTILLPDCIQVPVASWFDDMSDTELLDLIPFFERLSKVDDVYAVLKQQRTSS